MNALNIEIKNHRLLSKAEMKKVMGGTGCSGAMCPQGQYCYEDPLSGPMCIYPDIVASGTPGGDNGNPCPAYCEPTGASIYCSGYNNGRYTWLEGNCNTYPASRTVGLHNLCIADNGNFWC